MALDVADYISLSYGSKCFRIETVIAFVGNTKIYIAAIGAAAAKWRNVRIGAILHAKMLQDARMSGLGKLRAAPDIVVNGQYGPRATTKVDPTNVRCADNAAIKGFCTILC